MKIYTHTNIIYAHLYVLIFEMHVVECWMQVLGHCDLSNRKRFPCLHNLIKKNERGWENSRQLCKSEMKSRVCITVVSSYNIDLTMGFLN